MPTIAAPSDLDQVLSASHLIHEVRDQRRVRDAADARILALAVQWADRHTVEPALPYRSTASFLEREPGERAESPDEAEWWGLPTLRWDTAASFAAALGMSTSGGKALVRDALTLAHRLPRVWERVGSGEVQAWRARRIAQAVLGEPNDVAAYVDQQAAPRAQELGPVLLERLLDEAMLRLHAEEREIAQLEALDARYARLHEASINHTGIADLTVRGDWADVAAFDDALGEVAGALLRGGCEESLDVRRSMAVGVLADPERALALLRGEAAPRPRRTVLLSVHLGGEHLLGLEPVLLDEAGRPLLERAVREWCGRSDVRVSVRAVRHCGGCPACETHTALDVYEPSVADRASVELRDRHCVFPFCTRPARRCDCDHVAPFDPDHPDRGPTCPCNLAALCRHHHRLKTHAGWSYTVVEPGTYLWIDRYGQQFLREQDGTRDVSPTPAPRRERPCEKGPPEGIRR